MDVRVYAGQTVNVSVCGTTQIRVVSPGKPTRTIAGPGGTCASCSNATLASGLVEASDYAITTTTHGNCSAPHVFVTKNSPKWVNGGPNITCVTNCSTQHVFGGSIVVNPIDFMVSLQIPAGSHHCGGSLIAPGVVLTAAHCVSGDAPNMQGFQWLVDNLCGSSDCMSALVGAIDYSTGLNGGPPLGSREGRLRVQYGDWVSHPLYNAVTLEHDVAMVRLTGTMETVKREYALGPWSSRPVPSDVPLLSAVAVLGWGVDESGHLSTRLRNATMPSVPFDDCLRQWSAGVVDGSSLVPKDAVCAGSPYQTDSCSGDSGGPLILMAGNDGNEFGPQAGIVSHGVNSCGGESIPGVYASTADPVNRDWIIHQLNVWGDTTQPRGNIAFHTSTVGSDVTAPQAAFAFLPLTLGILNFAAFYFVSRRRRV